MVRGARFSFSQTELDFLCADLGPIPIARAFLRNLPTNFALRAEGVTRLRAAGRELLRSSPLLRKALEQVAALPD